MNQGSPKQSVATAGKRHTECAYNYGANVFELFDPTSELAIHEGASLPHWFQPGVTYFVTFRTEDSVPQALIHAWHDRRNEWLKKNGIDPVLCDWKKQLARNPKLEHEFGKIFTREFMAYLDQSYGECVLRRPEFAKIVSDCLLHFDASRYHMSDFVVMPNHVHLLVCLLGETEIEAQCYSWKKFTAGKINTLLGQRGRFWQEESFDHLVRSPEQFVYLQRYIAENPLKAGLKPGEYVHYSRPML